MPVEDRRHIAADHRFDAVRAYHAKVRRVLGLHPDFDIDRLSKGQCFAARKLIEAEEASAESVAPLDVERVEAARVERGDLQDEPQGVLFGSGR